MRRALIGTAAALALYASAAAPAQAHHDAVCTPPETGPVCVTGLQHVVPAGQALSWTVLEAAYQQLVAGVTNVYYATGLMPDGACVPDRPLCVSGLRQTVQDMYLEHTGTALDVVYGALCTALQRPTCPLPVGGEA